MAKKKKSNAGRPTVYSEEILTKTRDYIVNYEKFDDAIPSIAGLAVVLGISRETIYDWASQEEKKEFSYILADILSNQERILINKGLKGEFNSNITKLVLGKHGYKDSADITSNNKVLQGVVMMPQRDENSLGTPTETKDSSST